MKMKKIPGLKQIPWSYLQTGLLILLFAFSCSLVNAESIYQVTVNGQLALPQGDFKTNAADLGGGFGFDFIYQPKSLPFGIGASLGFIFYGYESYRDYFYSGPYSFPVDVSTTNGIFTGHFMIRYQSRQGNFRPYFEGLIGFNYLTTDTKIDESGWGDYGIDIHNFDDMSLSYGAGAGILWHLSGNPPNPNQSASGAKLWEILLDIKLRYLFGGEAEYLTKGSIYEENDQWYYDVRSSKTDMLTLNIGISFIF
jgi:hypothetical protein